MRMYQTCLGMVLLVAGVTNAAPVIELEIATERGLQITAPQEWLQLLTGIGIQNVRIRGVEPSDAPAVTNRGSTQQPRYHVVGILSAREQLRLPGGTFGRGDSKRLKDYFDRLAADGGERLTAPHTLFGLTEQELAAVLTDLTQPVGFETKGQAPRAVLDQLQAKLKLRFAVDLAAERILQTAQPIADELKVLSAGTGMAIMLRSQGLALYPEKPRGQAVHYRVSFLVGAAASLISANQRATNSPVGAALAGEHGAGKLNDLVRKTWPVGWETERAPGQAAPTLFEQLNAEIDGFSLAETLAAIGPRLKVPYYLDHAALAEQQVDPSAVQIKIPRQRIPYKRLLDSVLAQARLGCELRVDEAGTVFLWISN
jgi:hypothetical protein